MKKKRPQIRVVGHRIVSRKDPTKVLGYRPEDFPYLVAACKAAIATMTTDEIHVVRRAANQ
ncbi:MULTISPECIES: hypothetical protein [Brevibacillus]|uniref:hypothetical protein n=1 Tax=Brevibacillus TaxID=55080 RepID=UPI00148FE53B|nr:MULTISPECIES: hypothetical protein [Brevibacillus]MBY0052325.1 hypothetical protein [Brevibacillus agri]NOU54965.1 hypothetical protein [Brevibacillus borstelensis]